jgi:PAS domain S-box-containing protein
MKSAIEPSLDVPRGLATFDARLSAAARALVRRDAALTTVPRGQRITAPADRSSGPGILDTGTARGFLQAAGGRQLTVGYVGPGGLVGGLPLLAPDAIPVTFVAVTDCTIAWPRPTALAHAFSTDPAVAEALIGEVGRRLADAYLTLGMRTFGSIQERVARHLTDFIRRSGNERLAVPMTQQQLADAVGTAREVVARVLRDFRATGLVETRPGEVLVRDPVRLVALVGRWRRAPWPDDVGPPRGAESFLDASPMAIVAVDATSVITYANPSTERILGWSPAALVGKPLARLVPPRLARRHARHVAGYLADPQARTMGVPSDLAAVGPDGEEHPVEISLAPIETPSGTLVFATISPARPADAD